MPHQETKTPEKEVRSFKVDFKLKKRENGDGEMPIIEGYAAVFNSRSENLGGRYWEYYEEIMPGAFADALREDDVVANFNHDSNMVLARNTSGTLEMKEDEKGLFVEIDPVDATFARDLVKSIERGDINGMSFAFTIVDSYWRVEEEKEILYLEKVKLYDVSVVTHPAYRETSVGLRSLICDHLRSVMETSKGRAERAQKALEEFQKEEKKRDADAGDALPQDNGKPEKPAGEVREAKPPEEEVKPVEQVRETTATQTDGTAAPAEETRETGEGEVEPENEDWKVGISHRRRNLELLELSS